MSREYCKSCGFEADNIMDSAAGVKRCPVCNEMKSIVYEDCSYCKWAIIEDDQVVGCSEPTVGSVMSKLNHDTFVCSKYQET